MPNSANNSLAKGLDKQEIFYFQPYLYIPLGMMKPLFFEKAYEKLDLIPRETSQEELDFTRHHCPNTSSSQT